MERFHNTITPVLTVRHAAQAVTFYRRAFGAEEIDRSRHARQFGLDTGRLLCSSCLRSAARSGRLVTPHHWLRLLDLLVLQLPGG